MKKIFFLIATLLFLSCSIKEQSAFEEMKSDKLLSDSFTKKELKNLAKIVDFFEGEICMEVKETNIQKCYNKFLKLDSIRFIDKSQLYLLDYKKQKQLYSNLDSTFIKAFWNKAKASGLVGIKPEKRINYEYLSLKFYNKDGLSKYVSFLKKYSKQNIFFKNYIESAEISNDFPPLAGQSVLIYNYTKFNFSDIKIRLIYSLHHLNVNESNNYLQEL